MTGSSTRLWGGRFTSPTAADMAAFNDSFRFDERLADFDIRGSMAWSRALAQAGLIDETECNTLLQGLQQIASEFEAEIFGIHVGDEDIHTAVERRLTELVGAVAGKLHTGRSRNDQVATSFRLFCLDSSHQLQQRLRELQRALLAQAHHHIHTLMPGYTHLQRAQPMTFGYWCLAYIEMFDRDYTRLEQAAQHMRVLPLGSGALTGNSLNIDRQALADELGFDAISTNALDAVSDRDFVAELLFVAALTGTHLSRMAEDLILYSSAEFGFVELADAYSTGSSLMPQKKNPDSMELLRGKSGRLMGNLVAILTVLKGLPLAYNKDLQEDKEPLFDSIDTLDLGLHIAAAVVISMQMNPERMAAALEDSMFATDLADVLVRQGMPFREAHHKVGQLVRHALHSQVSLRALPITDYQSIHPGFDETIYALFDAHQSVAQKNSIGGCSPERVNEQIARWEATLAWC
ncbi:MAG: argininosuccinate lyase [Chloroflexaceae bacterium]|nr:argininosuccinate lyase [Chloroflexaceae bacterium]